MLHANDQQVMKTAGSAPKQILYCRSHVAYSGLDQLFKPSTWLLFQAYFLASQTIRLVQVYADRFEAEKVRLHVLLGMEHEGLERLGVHALGERETIINGVYEYLRAYLRAAEPFASGGR